jgi:hypothetical protein
MSQRLQIALGFTTLLLMGLAVAFAPFFLGSQAMQRFCAALELGATAAQVRSTADRQGYEVSYEALFAADGGTDGGAPTVVGRAFVSDPQFFRPHCLLRFDDQGQLTSRVFSDD